MDDDGLRREAKRRVEARNGFYWYLVVCIVVWGILTFVWWMDGGGYFWPAWAMLGMGIALIFVAANAFLPGAGAVTEDRIEREYLKMKRKAEGR
ncbi:2TM domain-containing protein [Demequina salsinemoris]|uniref:2TM domain-containing protein n=1 Tax=Demequina salsinemoris TaxID=577470 RepID=UPI00078321B4|nr:2TM domain-containing protein [Demequina salsinemoris]